MSENATVEWRRWLDRHWAAVLIAAMVLAPASASRAATLDFVEAEFDGVGGVDGLDGAKSVAVSPDGKHVYVIGNGFYSIAVFARNATTGALTFIEAVFDDVGGVNGLLGAKFVAVSPDGGHV